MIRDFLELLISLVLSLGIDRIFVRESNLGRFIEVKIDDFVGPYDLYVSKVTKLVVKRLEPKCKIITITNPWFDIKPG